MRSSERIASEFGRVDIYVFDQLMRGRLDESMRVLDAGCGRGRNIEYLMRRGASVFGVDADPDQIEHVRHLASQIAPALPVSNFSVARLDDLPFPDNSFDAVICSAVLHFSSDAAEFESMVSEMWRVLASGGVFVSRLASTIGIEDRVIPTRDRWHTLPDGSDRFLVDADYLLQTTSALDGELLDPLKTTVVQDMRSMTTWVLRKR